MKSYLHPSKRVEVVYPPATYDERINDFVALDLETTGLKRTEDIIEIGAIRVRQGKAVKKFSTFVKPRKSVPYLIEEITGITNIMLADAPPIEDVMPGLIKFIGDDVLLGHNIVSYDSKFICREAAELGFLIKNPLFDTLTYARRLKKLMPMPDSLSLSSLCDFFNIDRELCHRAYDDALANIKVFYYLRALEERYGKCSGGISLKENK